MDRKTFESKSIFVDDEGLTLEDHNHYLMQWCEENYIRASIDAIIDEYKWSNHNWFERPLTILEFGFGLGITASQFQSHNPDLHVIVEPHPEIYQSAILWRQEHFPDSNIIILCEYANDIPLPFKIYPFTIVYDDVYDICAEGVPSKDDFVNSKYYTYFMWWTARLSDVRTGRETPPLAYTTPFVYEEDGVRMYGVQPFEKIKG